MAESTMTDEIVSGDGVVSIPIETPGEPEMPIQLGDTLSELLLGETAGNIQSNNMGGRNMATIAIGTLEAGMAKQFNELDPTESRSVSGVLATPLAGPTTATP